MALEKYSGAAYNRGAMKVLNPLIERALELDPERVGNFLRTGKAPDGSPRLPITIDGKNYVLVAERVKPETPARELVGA